MGGIPRRISLSPPFAEGSDNCRILSGQYNHSEEYNYFILNEKAAIFLSKYTDCLIYHQTEINTYFLATIKCLAEWENIEIPWKSVFNCIRFTQNGLYADYVKNIDEVETPISFTLYQGDAYNLKWQEFKSIMKTAGYKINAVCYDFNELLMKKHFATKLLQLYIQ